MIDSLEIENIKAYINAKLIFSPGLNVITGDSSAGKSSIFRIITWILKNIPRGYNPKPWKCIKAPAGDSVGAVKFVDGLKIVRRRGARINSLECNGDTYAALQGHIPDNVATLINMAEVNFQPQEESFFLVADTGGEAAKKINKIANLEGMGETIVLAKSRVKSAKQKNAVLAADIKKLKEDISGYTWVGNARLDIADLKDRKIEIDTKSTAISSIIELMTSINILTQELKEFPPDQLVQDLEKLINGYNGLIQRRQKVLSVSEIISGINEYTREYTNAKSVSATLVKAYNQVVATQKELSNRQTKYNTITDLITQVKELETKIEIDIADEATLDNLIERWRKLINRRYLVKDIATMLAGIAAVKQSIQRTEQNLQIANKDLAYFIKQNPFCPICGGKL